MLFGLILCLWCEVGGWEVSDRWQQCGNTAEVAEISIKKIQKKKHTCSPNSVQQHCLGLFYVSDVTLGSGRSMESGGDMGDTAEVAEISIKKNTKKKILVAQTTSFGLVLCFWCDIGEWEVNREWWQCGWHCWGGRTK